MTELNQYQRDLEERLQNSSTLYRLEDVEKKWQDSDRVIQDIEQKGGLFGVNQRKNSQFQEESIRVLQDIYKLTQHNFDYVLNREALQIVKTLQQTVNSLATQASNFDSLLKNLQSSYDKKGDDIEHLNEDRMNGEAIFADADTNNSLENLLSEVERRSQFIAVSGKITEKTSAGESLIHFLKQDRLIDETQLQDRIDEIVESVFGSRSLNATQSVTKRFLQNYPFSDGETRLAQILQEAEPLLPLNLTTSYYFDESGKSFQIIGFKDTDERETKQFKELVTRNLGIPDNVIQPTQTEDEIVIVNEYAAFPLRLINGLERMREQYSRQQKYDSILLHNEYRKTFTDVIPPDARRMEELQDIFYACLAFGLLRENSHTQQYEFECYDALRHSYDTVELSGIWNEALEQLANSQDMTDTLKELRDNAITDIEKQPQQWENYYLPKLREFIIKVDMLPKDDPNYPEQSLVSGVKATIDTPSKKGILERIWLYIQEQVLTPNALPTSQNHSSNILTPSSGSIPDSPIENDEYVIPEDGMEIKSFNSNFMQELKDLTEMLKEGLITPEEFEVLKKELIKSYSERNC